MPVQVRRADLSDIPPLIELMREFYAESLFSLDTARAARSFTTLLSHQAYGAAWLGWCDDRVAGYVVLTQRFTMEFGAPDGFVDDLFVRPPFRRGGVAKALLQALMTESRERGLRAIHVEVDPANVAANALYRQFGLKDNGRRLLTVEVPAARSRSS